MADEYEKQFMGGDGALFVDRVPNRRSALAALAGGIGAVLGALNVVSTTGSWLGALVPISLAVLWCGGLALFFAYTRIAVTKEHVHVQLGMFGPKIPISAITSAKVAERRWRPGVLSFAEWGSGGVVEIQHTQGDATRTVIVPTKDPAGMVEAIARAQRGGAPTVQVRVAVDEDGDEEAAARDGSARERRA